MGSERQIARCLSDRHFDDERQARLIEQLGDAFLGQQSDVMTTVQALRTGNRDGLFWPTQDGEVPSPIGPLVAARGL
jgi:hypothetical protein